MSNDHDPATRGSRRLSYLGFVVVVLVYLVIIQGGGLLVQHVAGTGDSLATTREVLLGFWIPLGAALVFTYAVVAYLGWWRPVLRDDRPVARWVWVVPIIFIIGILAAIDYSALGQKSLGYVLILLIGTQFVGWGEEGMFRGISIVMLRDHGLTEGRVALWSSLIFGAVHLTNIISRGPSSIAQALIVSIAGYFFYLIRRVSRSNVLNSILHGLFDFSLLSGAVVLVGQKTYVGSGAAILVYVILIVVLLVRRRHIEPARSIT
jgi:hypothetical protein